MQGTNVNSKDIKDTNPIQPPVKSFDSEVNKMRWALTAITKEIQRFNYTENIETKKMNDFELLNKIFKYKLQIKMKKKQIKRLNQNVKMCYILVKLLISSKEKDSWNLTKSCLIERRKRVNLIKKNHVKFEFIRQLSKENAFFEKKLKDIQNYIYHVYNGLPNKLVVPSYNSDTQLLEKIKTIIIHYEQQNIYFYTGRAKWQLIDQKNSYLKNKISILECNIESLREELASLTYQLLKRDREIKFYKNKLFNKINHTELSAAQSPPKTTNPNKSFNLEHKNLSSHLALVNSLLIDQNSMINNLKCISDDIYSID